LSIVELVNDLRERKSALKFADATVESVWSDFLRPALNILGWDDPKPIGLNTIDPFVELGGLVRIAITAGNARSTRARSRSEVYLELAPDVNISVVTNFDEWEILFRDWSKGPIAEFRAEEFVSADGGGESEAWQKIVRLISRSAVEDGSYLHLANQLHQQRVDEAEINVYVAELNNLRKMIGDYLIQNPKELSPSKRGKPTRTAYQIMGITGKTSDRERDEVTLNQLIQRLIDRFLIFRFAEDNHILVEGRPKPLSDLYYNKLLGRPAETLATEDAAWREIAGSRDEAMTGLFGEFAGTYNGGVFEPLDGKRPDRINELPLNDRLVRDIVDQIVKRPVKKKLARLLGYIYEKYIGQRLYIVADPSDAERVGWAAGLSPMLTRSLKERVKQEGSPFLYLGNTPEKKKQAIYYTPEDVTRYITGKTVGALLDSLYEQLEAIKAISADERPQAFLTLFAEARDLSVLDPTCGSGAFLIEALGLMRQFYRVLGRTIAGHMDLKYLEEPDGEIRRRAQGAGLAELGEALMALKSPGVFALNWNIFGVDIDPRAVEICSVSLMIQVIEELVRPQTGEVVRFPSIMGENIKQGNSFVSPAKTRGPGTTRGDLRSAFGEELTNLAGLRTALRALTVEAERVGARQRIDASTRALYGQLTEHLPEFLKPFCWDLEFPEIFFTGEGFSVVIGNPPYTTVPEAWPRPTLRNAFKSALETWSRDENVFTFAVEHMVNLLSASGRSGLIVPLSITFSTKRPFKSLRSFMENSQGDWYVASFDRIPSAIFGNDVRTRCSVVTYEAHDPRPQHIWTTSLTRWNASERSELFSRIRYFEVPGQIRDGIPKLGSKLQSDTLGVLRTAGERLSDSLGESISFSELERMAPNFPKASVYVGGVAYNWFPAWRDIPQTTTLDGRPSLPQRTAGFRFSSDREADLIFAILCSSLTYWYWAISSDGFNLKKWLIDSIPVSKASFTPTAQKQLASLGQRLRREIRKHYVYKENRGQIGNFNLLACRDLTRQIDTVMAEGCPDLSDAIFSDIHDFIQAFVRIAPQDVQMDPSSEDDDELG
jgi:hypothetical protein